MPKKLIFGNQRQIEEIKASGYTTREKQEYEENQLHEREWQEKRAYYLSIAGCDCEICGRLAEEGFSQGYLTEDDFILCGDALFSSQEFDETEREYLESLHELADTPRKNRLSRRAIRKADRKDMNYLEQVKARIKTEKRSCTPRRLGEIIMTFS